MSPYAKTWLSLVLFFSIWAGAILAFAFDLFSDVNVGWFLFAMMLFFAGGAFLISDIMRCPNCGTRIVEIELMPGIGLSLPDKTCYQCGLDLTAPFERD